MTPENQDHRNSQVYFRSLAQGTWIPEKGLPLHGADRHTRRQAATLRKLKARHYHKFICNALRGMNTVKETSP